MQELSWEKLNEKLEENKSLKKKLKCKKKIDKYIAILRLVAYNRFYRYEGRNENEVWWIIWPA